MYRLVVLAFVASVSANSCPDVSTVQNFDFASYGQGTWYEIARYPVAAERGAECGSAEYTRVGDVITVNNFHVKNKKAYFITGTARMAPDANGSGKVIHTLPYGPNGAFTDSLLNILAVDYNKYVIGYYCKYDESTNSHKDFAWILSRSNNVSSDIKNEIQQMVKNSKVLDNDKLIWVQFTKDACQHNSEKVVGFRSDL